MAKEKKLRPVREMRYCGHCGKSVRKKQIRYFKGKDLCWNCFSQKIEVIPAPLKYNEVQDCHKTVCFVLTGSHNQLLLKKVSESKLSQGSYVKNLILKDLGVKDGIQAESYIY